MLTRIFKSGNSLAVRIPKELALNADAQEVEIERKGNTITIRLTEDRLTENKTLAGIGDIFKMFSPEFMASGREFHL